MVVIVIAMSGFPILVTVNAVEEVSDCSKQVTQQTPLVTPFLVHKVVRDGIVFVA